MEATNLNRICFAILSGHPEIVGRTYPIAERVCCLAPPSESRLSTRFLSFKRSKAISQRQLCFVPCFFGVDFFKGAAARPIEQKRLEKAETLDTHFDSIISVGNRPDNRALNTGLNSQFVIKAELNAPGTSMLLAAFDSMSAVVQPGRWFQWVLFSEKQAARALGSAATGLIPDSFTRKKTASRKRTEIVVRKFVREETSTDEPSASIELEDPEPAESEAEGKKRRSWVDNIASWWTDSTRAKKSGRETNSDDAGSTSADRKPDLAVQESCSHSSGLQHSSSRRGLGRPLRKPEMKFLLALVALSLAKESSAPKAQEVGPDPASMLEAAAAAAESTPQSSPTLSRNLLSKLIHQSEHPSEIEALNAAAMSESAMRDVSAESESEAPVPLPSPALLAQALKMFVAMASSQDSDPHPKRVAAAALASLAHENDENRDAIVESGAVRPLIALLRCTDAETQVQAAQALGNLAFKPSIRHVLIEQGAVPALEALKVAGSSKKQRETQATIQARRKAARALAVMGINDRVCKLPGEQGIRILSLDGGGTRGLVTIGLLKRLRNACGREIHEMFDLIAGTSTGGILAFLIGIKKHPIDHVEKLYRELSGQVFGRGPHPVVPASRMLTTQGFYDPLILERIMQREVGYDSLIATSEDPDVCKVFTVSALVNSFPEKPFLFRNYHYNISRGSRYPGSSSYALWEAIRATSAAPTYFPVFVGANGEVHSDGSMLANNPTAIALHEAKALWGPNANIECVVSLGTGISTETRETKYSGLLDIGRVLKNSATCTEQVHNVMEDLLPPGSYYRFNPPIADQKLADALDECRPHKLDQMLELAAAFMDETPTQSAILELSRKLNPSLRRRQGTVTESVPAPTQSRAKPKSPSSAPAPAPSWTDLVWSLVSSHRGI